MKIRRLLGSLLLVGIIAFGMVSRNTEPVRSNPYNQSSLQSNNRNVNRGNHMNNDFRDNWEQEYYEEEMPHNLNDDNRGNREQERRFYPNRMPHHGHHNQRNFNR